MLHSAAGTASGNTCIIGLRLPGAGDRPSKLVIAGDHRQTSRSGTEDRSKPNTQFERSKCRSSIGNETPVDENFASDERGIIGNDANVPFVVFRTACLSFVKTRRVSQQQDVVVVTVSKTANHDEWTVGASNLAADEILKYMNKTSGEASFKEADARFKKKIQVNSKTRSGIMQLVCKPYNQWVHNACGAAMTNTYGKELTKDGHVKLAIILAGVPKSFSVVGMAGEQATTNSRLFHSTALAKIKHNGRDEETMTQSTLPNVVKPIQVINHLNDLFGQIQKEARDQKGKKQLSLDRIACLAATFVDGGPVLSKHVLVTSDRSKEDGPFKCSPSNGPIADEFDAVGSGADSAKQYIAEHIDKLKQLNTAEDIDAFLLQVFQYVSANVKSVSPTFSRVILIEAEGGRTTAQYARVESAEEKKVLEVIEYDESPRKKVVPPF